MKRKPDDAYLEKAKKLSKEQVERLNSRMRNKLTRRTEDRKLTELEALAIQLALEDEQLEEWREERRKLNEKLEAKSKSKSEEKTKS
jgi:F0F1-type ATP synthase delta subunit